MQQTTMWYTHNLLPATRYDTPQAAIEAASVWLSTEHPKAFVTVHRQAGVRSPRTRLNYLVAMLADGTIESFRLDGDWS